MRMRRTTTAADVVRAAREPFSKAEAVEEALWTMEKRSESAKGKMTTDWPDDHNKDNHRGSGCCNGRIDGCIGVWSRRIDRRTGCC